MGWCRENIVDKYIELVKASQTIHITNLVSPDISILYTAIHDLLVMKNYKDDFNKKQNPVFAMRAFNFAHRNYLRIPFWVQNWLYVSFDCYDSSNGKENLNALLGFKKAGFNAFTALEKEEAYQDAYHGVALLQQALGISNNEAVSLYSSIKSLTFVADSLKQYYERHKEAKRWKEDDLVSGWFGDNPDSFDVFEFILMDLPKDNFNRANLRKYLIPLATRILTEINGQSPNESQVKAFIEKRVPKIEL